MMKECVATFIPDYAAGIFLTTSALLFHVNLTTVPQMNDHHYSSSPLLYVNEQFQRACHFPKFTYWLKSKVWDFVLRSYSKNNVFSLTEFYLDANCKMWLEPINMARNTPGMHMASSIRGLVLAVDMFLAQQYCRPY